MSNCTAETVAEIVKFDLLCGSELLIRINGDLRPCSYRRWEDDMEDDLGITGPDMVDLVESKYTPGTMVEVAWEGGEWVLCGPAWIACACYNAIPWPRSGVRVVTCDRCGVELQMK